MSFVLDDSGVTAKTFGLGNNNLHLYGSTIDDKDIHLEIEEMDFVLLVYYFMTNSDLVPGDIRLKMNKMFKSFEETKGLNSFQNENARKLDIKSSDRRTFGEMLGKSLRRFQKIRQDAKMEGTANIPEALIKIKQILSKSKNSKLKQEIKSCLKSVGV